MRFDVLTLFPDLFESYLSQSLLKLAIQRGLVSVKLWNFRDWATGKRKSVDDKPYGGGPGMLIMCPPVFDAIEAIQPDAEQPGQLVMLTPQGRNSIRSWWKNSLSTNGCCCCAADTKGSTIESDKGCSHWRSRSAISSATAAKCRRC